MRLKWFIGPLPFPKVILEPLRIALFTKRQALTEEISISFPFAKNAAIEEDKLHPVP